MLGSEAFLGRVRDATRALLDWPARRLPTFGDLCGGDALLRATCAFGEHLLRDDGRDIGNALAVLGRALGADRVCVFERSGRDGADIVSLRHAWAAMDDGGFPDSAALQGLPMRAAGLGRWCDAFERGAGISAPTRDLAAAEQAFVRHSGGGASLLLLPLRLGDGWHGMLGCFYRRPRGARRTELRAAQTCAALLASELRRRSAPHPAGARPHAAPQRPGQADEQRDLLVREVQHRVKNHLQGLSNLLGEHAASHPEAAAVLYQAMAQVRALAAAYGAQEQMARGGVRPSALVRTVAGGTGSSLTSRPITLLNDGDEPWLVADKEAVPLALVVNELLTNALKHGSGATGVAVHSVPEGARVHISNRGTLPPGFDFATGHGLNAGLQLVRSLLPPRGARLSFHQEGKEVTVRLTLTRPVLEPIHEMPTRTAAHDCDTRAMLTK